MARVKDWLIDMECYTFEAMDRGITNLDEIYAYVNRYVMADRQYIKTLVESYMGEEV